MAVQPAKKQRFNALALFRNALSYHQNWEQQWRSPEPLEAYDVIIVGGGGHGLATAYYLAKNPENEITIIERSKKPYQYTSFQNGCYFHTQGVESWINKPFWMFE